MNGEVRIGAALSGNLATHLTVSRFEILGPDAEVFLALDTVRVEYDPLALFRGQLRIRRLHAARLALRLTQYPDGHWNYERLFDPEAPALASLLPQADEDALPILLRDVTVASGHLRIQTPWTATLEGSERTRALREARAGESPWALFETPDGEFDQLYELSGFRGRFPVVRVTDPEAPFMIEVGEVSGTLLAVRQPLELTRLGMKLTLGDTAQIVVDRFETEQSTIRGSGWMHEAAPLAYAFALEAEPLDVRDLRWLPIDLPATGAGPMSISLRSRGPDMVVEVSGGDVRTRETRVAGGFTLALERRPRFEDLDVTLAPFDIADLDRLLEREPGSTGSQGWARGTLRGFGHTDDLTINADLTLEDGEPGTPPSGLRARGGVAIGEELFGMRGLEVELERFEPHWARLVGMDMGVGGRLDGTLTLDRPEGAAVAFAGAVDHLTPAGDLSRFSGSGTLDLAGSGIDAAFDVNPLSLALLRPWAQGIELAGAVTGPIRMRGNQQALALDAALESDRGRLTVNGDFDLTADNLRYDTRIEGTDLSLNQWVRGAPASRLAIRGRANGEGIDPATLEAAFDLEILPSEVDLAAIHDSRVRFSVADGLVTIDSLFLASDVGVLSANGNFGLAEGRRGRIAFEANAFDLSDWDRWFVDEIPGGAAAEAGEALFESFAAVPGAARGEAPTEGLDGRLTARGSATGRWEDFTFEVIAEASEARFRTYRADQLFARIELLDPPGTDILRSRLTATGVELDGRRLDSLSVRLNRSAAAATSADFYARRDSSLEVSGRADVDVRNAWSVGLADLRLRLGKLESTLAAPARLVYSDSGLVIDGLALEGQLGRLRAHGRIPASGASGASGAGDLSLEAFGVRVEQLGYLLSESPVIGGTLGGSARMTGTLTEPEFTGAFGVTRPSVRNQGYEALNARFSYSGRQLEGAIDLVDDGERIGRLGGTVATDLSLVEVERRLLDAPLDLELTGDRLPLALVELAVEGLDDVTGIADAELAIRGSPRALRYDGGARLIDGRAWVPDIGVWLSDVGARIEFHESSVAVLDSVYVGSDLGGSARATGTVDIERIRDAVFDLDVEATDFHAVSRRDVSLAVSGAGRLIGSYTAPELVGDYVLSNGNIRQDEFIRQREIFDLSDPAIDDLLEAPAVDERRILERFRNPFMNNLVVSARVALGPDLWLRSPQLDVELASEGLTVYLDRAEDELFVTGGVELSRGTYRYIQRLRITDGTIQFVGNPGFNPNLDLTAEYRNRTMDGPVSVEAHITGTLRESQLVLTSNPPMSENDQLCLLSVGTPCYRSSDQQLGQRLVQQMVLSTLSSGISSALQGATGLPYFNLTSIGTGVGSGSVAANRSVFERTAVEFGWYANNNLFLSFWQPLGGGPPRATVEWSFLPSWSVEARTASRFDERLFGLNWGTNLANDRTFRLFIFREWAFGSGSP